jgi:pimeloyl-ACP methyl ester carboxylesterase
MVSLRVWVFLLAALWPVEAKMKSKFATVNGVRLHYVENGKGTLMLFLHGFPEFWYAWKPQLAEFGRDHKAVAVDMRGYNLSAKPEPVEEYRIPNLVGDIHALARKLKAKRFVLVGHDWGGVVAWAYAMTHPEMLEKLVIINAPHPAIFSRELRDNPAQQRASQYMQMFRSQEAERILSDNNYQWLTRAVLASVGEADKPAYLEAWSQPRALTGGLNYYRAMALGGLEMRKVVTPTLVIWGEKDTALLTGNLNGLEEHVERLTVKRIPDASHWVVHEKPDQVAKLMREFLAAK